MFVIFVPDDAGLIGGAGFDSAGKAQTVADAWSLGTGRIAEVLEVSAEFLSRRDEWFASGWHDVWYSGKFIKGHDGKIYPKFEKPAVDEERGYQYD